MLGLKLIHVSKRGHRYPHIDGSVQERRISSALAIELVFVAFTHGYAIDEH